MLIGTARGIGLLIALAPIFADCLTTDPPEVETPVGIISGLINDTAPNVAQFLGIPFAEPPVGGLRWSPPVAKSPADKINATSLGPSCPQFEGKNPSVYFTDARGFVITPGEWSEDCLTLNIWAPLDRSPRDKLPVLVWIYGGGFSTGGGNIPYQIPSNWVQRSQAHIVVGINYRVNIFGFPNAAGLDESELNLGLLDQRLALEWVRSNIESFGGDTSRITLWGQSAGGASVDYYNFAYPDDPIISSLIMDSGNALSISGTNEPGHDSFTYVANQFGCGDLSAKNELACLRNISSVEIEGLLKDHSDNGASPSLSFSPVVENRTKFENYTARALARNFTLLPAIIGTNANEGSSLVGYSPDSINQSQADATTIGRYLCPAEQTAKNRYTAGATTFRYLYAGNFSNIAPRPWQGAYHSSELPLIFGTSGIAHGENTPFEEALSEKMQKLWLAFISDPVKGLPAEGWLPYAPSGRAVEFGKGHTLVGHIGEAELGSVCDGAKGVPGATPPQ